MRRPGGILLVGVAAAAAAAVLSAHATSAAPVSGTSTFDATYSCPVAKTKVVFLYAGAKLPKTYNPITNDKASPGEIVLATGGQHTDTTGRITLPTRQLDLVAKKNGITIDGKSCTKLKKRIQLSKKGLGSPVTAKPKFLGYTYNSCDTALRKVVFRLQVHLIGGTPTDGVLAVRNANAKAKPIAFIQWSPQKVNTYLQSACYDLRN